MMLSKLWGRIRNRIRPLFWPMEGPRHEYIKAMVNECPLPADPNAAANKRHFVWRFAYWAFYHKGDPNLLPYWELIKDSNDPEFWRAVSGPVRSILAKLLQ
jgi:hypothetical protein